MAWILSTPNHFNLFASLGVQDGNSYIPNQNCLLVLREIRKQLAQEDPVLRTFRRFISVGQNVKKDILPILANVKNPLILNETICVIVGVTVPVECLLPMDVINRHDISGTIVYELNRLLRHTKQGFCDPKVVKAILDYMRTFTENDKCLSFEQCDVVNNCLLVLRNILHIPDDDNGGCFTRAHNQIVWSLFTYGIDKILLHLINHPQSFERNGVVGKFWSVTMIQLIALIYKDQHVNTLHTLLSQWFEPSVSESSDNESNTSPKPSMGELSPDWSEQDTHESVKKVTQLHCDGMDVTNTDELSSENKQQMDGRTDDGYATQSCCNTCSVNSSDKMTPNDSGTNSGNSGKRVCERPESDNGTDADVKQMEIDETSSCASAQLPCYTVRSHEMPLSCVLHVRDSTSSSDESPCLHKTVRRKPMHLKHKKDKLSACDKSSLRRRKLVKRSKTNIFFKDGRTDDGYATQSCCNTCSVNSSDKMTPNDSGTNSGNSGKRVCERPESDNGTDADVKQMEIDETSSCASAQLPCYTVRSHEMPLSCVLHVRDSTSSSDESPCLHKTVRRKPMHLKHKKDKLSACDKSSLRRRKLVKRSKTNIIAAKCLSQHAATDDDISMTLKEFTIDFLLKGFSPLVDELFKHVLTDVNASNDKSHFFWVLTYFLKFSTQLELDIGYVQAVLTRDLMLYLIYEAVHQYELIAMSVKHNSTLSRDMSIRSLHLVVTSMREYLRAIIMYERSNNVSKESKQFILKLHMELASVEQCKFLFVMLLRSYDRRIQSHQYLQDLIVTNHYLIIFLEMSNKLPDIKSELNISEYLKKFATKEIMINYGLLLETFHDNQVIVNDSVLNMMYHVAGEVNNPIALFQTSILRGFLDLSKSSMFANIREEWKDVVQYILNKFLFHVRQSGMIGTDILSLNVNDNDLNHVITHICTTNTEPKPLTTAPIESNPKCSDETTTINRCKELLVLNNCSYYVLRLQKALLDACYVKIRLQNPDFFDVHDEIMEPVPLFYITIKKPIPVVTWDADDFNAASSPVCSHLLRILEFDVSEPIHNTFVHIPIEWTPVELYNKALKLAPIHSSKSTFYENLLKISESLMKQHLQPSDDHLFSLSTSQKTELCEAASQQVELPIKRRKKFLNTNVTRNSISTPSTRMYISDEEKM